MTLTDPDSTWHSVRRAANQWRAAIDYADMVDSSHWSRVDEYANELAAHAAQLIDWLDMGGRPPQQLSTSSPSGHSDPSHSGGNL
ncbi:hypothetical protein REH65_00130 [Saccharopolyspora sp. ID03-671]|uniref:hypothetical protein n=1 Tax=Saccharopolyspora sp. ID03-671 TaxID=3073066 RepID=UPI00324E2EDC